MPKIFSDEQKEDQRNLLFQNGLRKIMELGYKNVTVDDLVDLIGSSKGYFYLLFPSKEDFFLEALCWQMKRHREAIAEARQNGATLEEIGSFYRNLFLKGSLANYMDMLAVQKKVSRERWEQFLRYEEDHYTQVIKTLGKDPTYCDPKVLCNLAATILLSYDMAKSSPYLFQEKNDDVLDILLNAMHRYILDH